MVDRIKEIIENCDVEEISHEDSFRIYKELRKEMEDFRRKNEQRMIESENRLRGILIL